MKPNRTKLPISVLTLAAALQVAMPAYAWSKKVEDACKKDFNSFCSQYAPGSTEVRRCFESNRKVLSRKCINALVDAGEVPAKYLKR